MIVFIALSSSIFSCNGGGETPTPELSINSTSITFFSYPDVDFDNIRDEEDNIIGNASNINHSGISEINMTVGGNSSIINFEGEKEVIIYDSNTPLLNLTYNFSKSVLNMSKITIIQTDNSILFP